MQKYAVLKIGRSIPLYSSSLHISWIIKTTILPFITNSFYYTADCFLFATLSIYLYWSKFLFYTFETDDIFMFLSLLRLAEERHGCYFSGAVGGCSVNIRQSSLVLLCFVNMH